MTSVKKNLGRFIDKTYCTLPEATIPTPFSGFPSRDLPREEVCPGITSAFDLTKQLDPQKSKYSLGSMRYGLRLE
jgi:hypothetical protein